MGVNDQAVSWRLLIYTVPSEPSRKRAYVWRELKKAGAIYLRDGVCVLPELAGTVVTLRAIARRIEEFGGQATLVEGAHLDAARAEMIIAQSRAARTEEYAEISREAERFLEHIRRETAHREFTFPELEELEVDLDKLKRWIEQVAARDYFGLEVPERVSEIIARCEEELSSFLEKAFCREDKAS